jgi:hypothetical protein
MKTPKEEKGKNGLLYGKGEIELNSEFNYYER